MNLAQLIREMNKNDYEYKHGRIFTWPNLWTWQGKYPAENESYATQNPDGRTAVRVSKIAVRCPNPELWNETEWYFEHQENCGPLVWLPVGVCRKCPHYMKSDKRGKQRWPRCKLSRVKRKGERIDTAGDAMRAAISATNKLMGG